MKKSKVLIVIPLFVLFLSGCATYSVKKGESPYNNGFIVTRYDRVIPEYTIGKDNTVPDEKIARERFERRRVEVETYYKKMGYIENRFKQNFVDPPVFMLQAALGVFRIPAIAIADYNYNHDPKYKEKIDKEEDVEYKAEKERIKALKGQLNSYIKQDLEKESALIAIEQKTAAKPEVKEKIEPVAEVKEPVKEPVKEEAPVKEVKTVSEEKPEPPKKIEEALLQQPIPAKEEVVSPAVSEPKPEEKAVPEVIPPKAEEKVVPLAPVKEEKPLKSPVAVIIAKPIKGNSPLFVQFNAAKSYSPNGRIVSYLWDFGDGDTSTKKNPTNSYWSTTYGKPRQYTAKLTVKDNKGEASESTIVIEVLTK